MKVSFSLTTIYTHSQFLLFLPTLNGDQGGILLGTSRSLLQNKTKSKVAFRWNSYSRSFIVAYMDDRAFVSHDFNELFSSLHYNSLGKKISIDFQWLIGKKSSLSLIPKSTHGKNRFLLCTKEAYPTAKRSVFYPINE